MNVAKAAAMLSVSTALFVIHGAALGKGPSSEQAHFRAEDKTMPGLVALPPEALIILSKDTLAAWQIEESGGHAEQLFLASEVTLGGNGEKAYVVRGDGPLRSVDAPVFWIFAQTAHGLKLVLRAPADELILRKTHTFGHKDIDVLQGDSEPLLKTTFRFDGKQYELDRQTQAKLK